MHNEGTISDDGKSITQLGERVDPQTGKAGKIRTVWTLADPGQYTIEWYLPDEKHDCLVVADAFGPSATAVAGLSIPTGARLTGWVAASRQPIVLNDSQTLTVEVDVAPGTARPQGKLWVVTVDEEGRITANCQLLRKGAAQWQWATDLYPDLEETPATPIAHAPAATSASIPSSPSADPPSAVLRAAPRLSLGSLSPSPSGTAASL